MEENNRLIDGIIKSAETDAEKILLDAEKTIEQKNSAFETASTNIIRETDEKIAEKTAELEQRAESTLVSEKRRRKLRLRERLNKEVVDRFNKKISEIISTDQYTDFLCKLIAEGAVAVNDSRVFVRCSFKESVTEDMLKKAGDIVKEQTGKNIVISLSEAQPLAGQGISVESSDGRISYNNQISARLRRFDEDIKMIILNGLAKEE